MENFIRRYRVGPEYCGQIIKWFEDNPQLHEAGVVGTGGSVGEVVPTVKQSTIIQLSLAEAYEISEDFRAVLDHLWDCVATYTMEFEELTGMNFSMTEKFMIARYLPGEGFFSHHCERTDVWSANRLLVWLVYLTSNGAEGGTHFRYLDHTEHAEAGKLLVWPPDFTHSHRGVTDEKTKYILTGWYDLINF